VSIFNYFGVLKVALSLSSLKRTEIVSAQIGSWRTERWMEQRMVDGASGHVIYVSDWKDLNVAAL